MKISRFKKHNSRGALFIEAALAIPLLLYLIIYMMYFALYMHDYLGLNNLARNAVRIAAVNASNAESGNETTSLANKKTSIKKYVNANAGSEMLLYSIVPSDSTITVSDKLSGDTGSYLVLRLSAKRAGIPVLVENLIPIDIASKMTMYAEENLSAGANVTLE